MPDQSEVSGHYTHGDLVAAIRKGIESLGKQVGSVTVDDLAPVDEFHIGGRQASEDFLGQLELTPEYVETGKTVCDWLGLDGRVSLHQGSALELPFADGSFDRAYMLHVGMNISDKARLCTEVGRVLKGGGVFGVYDVMQTGEGELTFPVPWATTASSSAVAPPAVYREALQKAGFTVTAERNRRDFALEFFDRLRARTAAAGGPPPLGLHILMGRNTPDKVQNMIANIAGGRIAPVEIIARKG